VSLDLSKVASQVERMVARLKAAGEGKRQHLANALRILHDNTGDIEKLRRKIISARTTWLVAGLVDGLDSRHKAPIPPDDFTVVAADGSHIEVDRHRAARCYLINIGSVLLRYGSQPDATLENHPSLYAGDEDLVILPDGKGREQPVEGTLLGIKRSVDECRRLAELAAELPDGSSALGLIDGSLILWGLEAYPEFVTEMLLINGFLKCFETMRNMKDRKLALASYISLPRSTDVVNALRVAICPYEPPDCDRYCPAGKRDCEAVAGIQDQELFSSLLEDGERSPLFTSQSSVVRKYYGNHQIYFFYLRVDDEIARVEIPEWVAMDEALLDLTHSLVADQCHRGQGYPVALSEAHEQAVVTTADRENFWQLVESSLILESLPTPTSGKNRSKRTRWV
jgi:GNAT superfamily N-acetyltransferase